MYMKISFEKIKKFNPESSVTRPDASNFFYHASFIELTQKFMNFQKNQKYIFAIFVQKKLKNRILM